MTNIPGPVLLALAALAACSRSAPKPADSSVSTPTAATGAAESSAGAGASTTPTKPACPRTGKWALCSVETRLGQSGFVVRRVSGDARRRAGFSVAPAVYTLGRTRLEVFIYPNESALAADVAKIDTVIAAPRGSRNPWLMIPTFVRSANLAAVFLTDNPTQAERFTLALTAGAPQP
jgi:hypothetical protein